MNEQEYFIFAELKRDYFEEILDVLMRHFQHVQFGRQGDDWIWIHMDDDKIEIDTFYSEQLEVKGRQIHAKTVKHILQILEKGWILKRFDPPKADLTR